MTPWTLERIYARCEHDEGGDCRLWTGPMNGPYPICQVKDPSKPHGWRQLHVRRLVWQQARPKAAPASRRYVLIAKCGQERCVADGCLAVITKAERTRQAAAKGVFRTIAHRAAISRGRSRRSALSDADVAAIRASSWTGPEIAEAYGISVGYANALKSGRNRPDYSSPFAALVPIQSRVA